MNEETVYLNLLDLIRKRFVVMFDKSLSDFNDKNWDLEDQNLEDYKFLENNRKTVKEILTKEDYKNNLIEFLFDLLKIFTYGKNQFINFTETYEKKIKKGYSILIDEIFNLITDKNDIEFSEELYFEVVNKHQNELRLIFKEYLDEFSENEVAGKDLLKAVMSSEYSPLFQLNLLKINPYEIEEPILDIGCGEKYELINIFKNIKLNVLGIDRLIKKENINVKKIDWLDFNFEKKSWGTIIAHQSFSTNFIFHHNHSEKMAELYAIKMMNILDSLKINGSFYYTPGLPFFEEHLERLDNYKIYKFYFSPALEEIKNISYSSRIKRIK